VKRGSFRDGLRARPRWQLMALAIVAAVGVLIAAALVARHIIGGRDPVWARIQERGVWRVGMDPSFPPFENLDAAGQPVGLDVDLARAIATRWGVQLELVGVGFDELTDAVAAHKIDAAISALPITEYRTVDVAFSQPYVEAGQVLAVPRDSTVASAKDLGGLRVAVEWGSEGDARVRKLQRELDGGLTPVARESVGEALDAVLAGDADAAIVDAISLALHAGSSLLRVVKEPVESDPYVIVLPVAAPELRSAVNDALAALEADGTLDEIRGRWLKP
jgi:ABC-type amino acid transport substrate-binding protein